MIFIYYRGDETITKDVKGLESTHFTNLVESLLSGVKSCFLAHRNMCNKEVVQAG